VLDTLGLWHTVVRPLLIRLRVPFDCSDPERPTSVAVLYRHSLVIMVLRARKESLKGTYGPALVASEWRIW
jgi:hypothetical protein